MAERAPLTPAKTTNLFRGTVALIRRSVDAQEYEKERAARLARLRERAATRTTRQLGLTEHDTPGPIDVFHIVPTSRIEGGTLSPLKSDIGGQVLYMSKVEPPPAEMEPSIDTAA
jgi:hypothetical protein